VRREGAVPPRRVRSRARERCGGGPDAYEEALVQALAGAPTVGEEAGIALYRTLVASFRNGALSDLLPNTLRLLALHLGTDGLEVLLQAYRTAAAPPLFPADEAMEFASWVGRHGPDLPYLDDLLALEAGVVRIVSEGTDGQLSFRHDPTLILAAIEEGHAPSGLAAGDFRLTLGAAAHAPSAAEQPAP
jgi:hypothetical protein